jgi:ASC-1-like (ASCH) protein
VATRHLKTRPDWEDALRGGIKTIDARPVADDIAGLEVGDLIQYPGALLKVRRVRFYPGFGDLIAYEDWRRIAPGATGPDEVLRILRGDHISTVQQSGAVAIELAPIRD